MSEWRFAAAAVVLAGLLEAILPNSALAQQGAPPPAVLVQAAEAKPIAAQSEFIGRAAAVDKVDLHARVKGFLGPRLFTDGDEVKEGQVVFTIEPETFQAAVAQKVAQRDAAKAALANADIQLQARRRTAAHQYRHAGGLRPAGERAAAGQGGGRRRRGATARRPDPALLHRDQVADRRAHWPRFGIARQPRQPADRRARDRGQRPADARAVLGHPARAARGAARCLERRRRLAGRVS